MEGIMMRGETRSAVAVRLPDNSMHIRTQAIPEPRKITKVPIIRGIFVFGSSLVLGTKTLLYSADVLEKYEEASGNAMTPEESKGKATLFVEKHFGERAAWNFMLYTSVVMALFFSVGIFVVGPTWIVNFASHWVTNEIGLNLIEGVFRILLFVIYVLAISKMPEIHTTFQYHGAEHKCIHCFENGLDLTPENCKGFYTLHPRCGTSFLMFVMIISLILFSLLGWPNLLMRITSRLVLIPLIAGLSYELLRWAGRSSGPVVKILSMPGLYLQKLTTAEPDESQLQVAIAAMKAVMVPSSTPYFEGLCDLNGEPIKEVEGNEPSHEGTC